jgi:hypothetical protein
MESSRKKEEGKGSLRSLEGSRKTGAQSACLFVMGAALAKGGNTRCATYPIAQPVFRI